MRKRIIIIAASMCMAMLVVSCGKKENTAPVSEVVERIDSDEQNTIAPATESQETDPALSDEASENMTENVSIESESEAALDNGTNNISEEQRTGEAFNVRDYLADPVQQDSQMPSEESASAPVEYETADGFMSSFLLASDRDKIDTTNEYGVFYRVVYEASLEGDELIACGSMDYRNSMAQDSIYISSDLKHVFKVDVNTVYEKGGEESTVTVSKEEFAELLNIRKDSGMFLGVEIKNGVVTTAMLSAQ